MSNFKRFRDAMDEMENLIKEAKVINQNDFHAAADQAGWHLMSRFMSAGEEISDALSDFEDSF